MRFYGVDDAGLLKMPIRRFWALNGYIDRIRAEEALAQMPVMSTVMGGEHVAGIVGDLQRTVGNPVIAEQIGVAKKDQDKLKKLFG